MKLSEAKKLFPIGTEFYSATRLLDNVSPLRVSYLRYANHFDRSERIKEIDEIFLKTFNQLNHPHIKQKLVSEDFKDQDFAKKVEKLIEEQNYLLSLKKDIINESGGVIYCGETDSYARRN